MCMIVISYVIVNFKEINNVIGVTSFVKDIDTVDWETVTNVTLSEDQTTNDGLNDSPDIIGKFPMYFFVHNMECEDINISMYLMDTKKHK